MELIKYRGGNVIPPDTIMDEFKNSSLRVCISTFYILNFSILFDLIFRVSIRSLKINQK
jgi:hypothetical protein